MTPPEERSRAAHEAIVLPFLFWTVAFGGGIRLDGPTSAVRFLAPPLFSLVLGCLLMALLVQSGILRPALLAGHGRSLAARLAGTMVMVSLFAACVQVVSSLVPDAGLLSVLFNLFLAVLLTNTLAAQPDRTRLLRSLAVILGWFFVLKHVVLAALFDPGAGWGRRMVAILLDGMTQTAPPPSAPSLGYVAFGTIGLYFVGLLLLPGGRAESAGRIAGS